MKVDTLFLSGCGGKISGYIGVFHALLEKKIINLDKIERYVCCSAGAITGFYLICGLSLKILQAFSEQTDYSKLINLDDLNKLFENQGLFSNKNVGKLISSVLYYKYKKRDMSLEDFYKRTKKHFVCKVYNISKKRDEFICYKTNPELSIVTLICMTTCIPIFFKPIVYKDDYYIDGGYTGSMPFTTKYKNYLGIYICSCPSNNIKDMSPIDYILSLIHIISETYKFSMDTNRFIKITCLKDAPGNFNVSNESKKKNIQTSYNIAISHINKYLIDK